MYKEDRGEWCVPHHSPRHIVFGLVNDVTWDLKKHY